jgi:hypothetical protein
MTKKAGSNKVLYWALQDVLNKAQTLSHYGEAVTSLKQFLEEVVEVTEELLCSISASKKDLDNLVAGHSGTRPLSAK